jgi:hypothetical protein
LNRIALNKALPILRFFVYSSCDFDILIPLRIRSFDRQAPMNYPSIIYVLGILLVVTGSSMGLPAICSIYYKENDLYPILISGIIILAVGLPLAWFFRKNHELNIKDSFFIAVFGWVLISAV